MTCPACTGSGDNGKTPLDGYVARHHDCRVCRGSGRLASLVDADVATIETEIARLDALTCPRTGVEGDAYVVVEERVVELREQLGEFVAERAAA